MENGQMGGDARGLRREGERGRAGGKGLGWCSNAFDSERLTWAFVAFVFSISEHCLYDSRRREAFMLHIICLSQF